MPVYTNSSSQEIRENGVIVPANAVNFKTDIFLSDSRLIVVSETQEAFNPCLKSYSLDKVADEEQLLEFTPSDCDFHIVPSCTIKIKINDTGEYFTTKYSFDISSKYNIKKIRIVWLTDGNVEVHQLSKL